MTHCCMHCEAYVAGKFPAVLSAIVSFPIFAILPKVLSRKFSRESVRSPTLCREGNSPREARESLTASLPSYFASSRFLSHSGSVKQPRSRNENIQRLFTASISSGFRPLSRSERNCGRSALGECRCIVAPRPIVSDAAT